MSAFRFENILRIFLTEQERGEKKMEGGAVEIRTVVKIKGFRVERALDDGEFDLLKLFAFETGPF